MAMDRLNLRFAGSAGVPPAEQLNSSVLAFGIGASRIHNIAYRFRRECRLWRHLAAGTAALPANHEIIYGLDEYERPPDHELQIICGISREAGYPGLHRRVRARF